MSKFLKHIRFYRSRIITLTIIGSIVLTIASMGLHCEKWASTKMGDLTEKEAQEQGLQVDIYCGWPELVLVWGIGIMPGENLISTIGGTILFNLFSLNILVLGSAPNLFFWGLFSLIVILIFYTVIFLVRPRKGK